jgi:hypothetical protein
MMNKDPKETTLHLNLRMRDQLHCKIPPAGIKIKADRADSLGNNPDDGQSTPRTAHLNTHPDQYLVR